MEKMNYALLLGRIRELGYTQKSVAGAAKISEGQFCQKLAGHYPFKQTDIRKLCACLDIPAHEIGDYFFTLEVEKTQQK